MKMSEVSGSGSVPLNGFIDLFETAPVVIRNGMTLFRAGYVDTNVANYPQANQMSWLYPLADASPLGGWSQVSAMEYRFGRYIFAASNAASTGILTFYHSTDFVSFPSASGGTLTVQATQSPVLAWDSTGNILCCYVSNHTSRFKTTDGINWATEALTGLTGHVVDAIKVGSTWIVLTTTGIHTSTNGVAFTLRQAWSAGAVTDAGKLAVDASNNIVAMMANKSVYYSSSDTTNWTSQSCPSNHIAQGHVAYGDNKWQALFKSTISNVVIAATSSNFVSWTLGITTGFAGRWNSALSVWLGMPFGHYTGAQQYSKNGIHWIETSSGVLGIGSWVVVGSKTYGLRSNGGVTTPCSASHLGAAVGLPYSLSSLAITSNKFLRVK